MTLYATTPPRHRLKISIRTRRTAGHLLPVARVGATRPGHLVSRATAARVLLLAPLSHLLQLPPPPLPRSLALLVPVVGPTKTTVTTAPMSCEFGNRSFPNICATWVWVSVKDYVSFGFNYVFGIVGVLTKPKICRSYPACSSEGPRIAGL